MEKERVLILGTTGVNKNSAIENLKKYQQDHYGSIKFESIDFEEIVKKANGIKGIYTYLDADEDTRRRYWINGWNIFKEKLKEHLGKNILLSMHAVLARRAYGTTSSIIVDHIVKDFSPTKIIILIENVYLKWHRTQKRAGSKGYFGKPTLEQLLQARRTEIFLGDFIAKQARYESPWPRHYVISVHHPARLLDRVIFRQSLKTVYLSFPISKPRKLLKESSDHSGVDGINSILSQVSKFERENSDIAFFCPLTIDEYPLLEAPLVDNKRVFNIKNRWNVRDFYNDDILLADNDLPEEIKIPDKEVGDVKGMIQTDVGVRDYSLVAQSDYLAVFNPVFKTVNGTYEFSNGVYNEIRYAVHKLKPVHIYQDEKYDPNKIAIPYLKTNSPAVGGETFGADYITFHNSLNDLLAEILK